MSFHRLQLYIYKLLQITYCINLRWLYISFFLLLIFSYFLISALCCWLSDYSFILTAFLRLVGTVGALDESVASLIGADAISIGALELVPSAS